MPDGQKINLLQYRDEPQYTAARGDDTVVSSFSLHGLTAQKLRCDIPPHHALHLGGISSGPDLVVIRLAILIIATGDNQTACMQRALQ